MKGHRGLGVAQGKAPLISSAGVGEKVLCNACRCARSNPLGGEKSFNLKRRVPPRFTLIWSAATCILCGPWLCRLICAHRDTVAFTDTWCDKIQSVFITPLRLIQYTTATLCAFFARVCTPTRHVRTQGEGSRRTAQHSLRHSPAIQLRHA